MYKSCAQISESRKKYLFPLIALIFADEKCTKVLRKSVRAARSICSRRLR